MAKFFQSRFRGRRLYGEDLFGTLLSWLRGHPSGPSSGSGRVLEDGASYRVLEDGTSYRVTEAG